jgi:hypothetical protein
MPWWKWWQWLCPKIMAPEKNTTDKMNMIPATITTHAAAT